MGHIYFCSWCGLETKRGHWNHIGLHWKTYSISDDVCDTCRNKALELRDRLRGHVPLRKQLWDLIR